MAYIESIRRNPKTLSWEHWVQPDGEPGYWLEGLFGRIFTQNGNYVPANTLSDLDGNSGIVNVYESVDSGIVITNTKKSVINLNQLKRVKDISITELIDNTNVDTRVPIILKYSLSTDIIMVNDTILNAELIVHNPISEDSLKYSWKLNDKEISNKPILNEVIKNSTGKSLIAEVTNKAGTTLTQNIIINTIDVKKSSLFGNNLIKNTDGSTGMSNWTVSIGNPKVGNSWSPITQVGRGDGFTAFNGSAEDINIPNRNVIGPQYQQLTDNWNFDTFFEGGQEYNSDMYCDIDLSTISEIIDKNVLNANNVKAKLFGYLGGSGTAAFYLQPDYGSAIMTQWWCFDRVKVSALLLDENDNVINNNYFIYNPFTSRYRDALFLRNVDFYLPIGTRKIRILINFERYNNYTYYPTMASTNTQAIDTIRNEGIDWIPVGKYNDGLGADKSRGYIVDEGNFVMSQLSMATFINLFLSVDNYNSMNNINDIFKLNPDIINKLDEQVIAPWEGNNNSRIFRLSMDEVYSSLYDKFADLISLGYTNSDQIINNIKSDSWFTTKFNEREINSVVYNDITALTQEYNNRLTYNKLYI
jgi:hypothetical protein